MYRIQNNIFYKSQKEEKIFELNEEHKLHLMIVDDFYEDPMAVREFALSQEINIGGHFPGHRTIPFANVDLKNAIQECIKSFGEIDEYIDDSDKYKFSGEDFYNEQYNSAFFLNTVSSDMQWIHLDSLHYTAITFLSINAPIISGTSIFENKKKSYIDGYDKTEFIEIDKIGNKFNRTIIFNSHKLHLPNNYFGHNKYDGRLTQVSWFNIKKHKIKYEKGNTSENKIICKSKYPCKLNPNKQTNLIVIDNFYKNPFEVRNFALLQNFDIEGNYPGFRTKPFIKKSFKKVLNKHIKNFVNKISLLNINNVDNDLLEHKLDSTFQYTLSTHKSWIHRDKYNEIAGLIYLTPNAPITSGTTFYEYNDKNSNEEQMYMYCQDMSKWKEIDIIGNVFNRFILFNSKLSHMSRDYFGRDKYNGRLFQVFFI
jgi:hypothetical protein